MSDNCGGCRFFRSQQIMGVCRLYPQQQNKHESDWCGQYQVRKIKMVNLPVYDITTDQMTAPKRKYVRKANAEASA